MLRPEDNLVNTSSVSCPVFVRSVVSVFGHLSFHNTIQYGFVNRVYWRTLKYHSGRGRIVIPLAASYFETGCIIVFKQFHLKLRLLTASRPINIVGGANTTPQKLFVLFSDSQLLGKLSTDNKFLVFCVIEEVEVVNWVQEFLLFVSSFA